SITLTATDVEASPLTFTIVSGPAHGTLTGTPPTVSYQPAANYNGSDSFTFKANDGELDSNVATATITVTPVNDAPVAVDSSYGGVQDSPLVVGAPGVLVNAADADGDGLRAILVSNPSHGVAALNNDGSFIYTPSRGYSGGDSFTYVANDGRENSNVATVVIQIAATSHAPIAASDAYSTNEHVSLAVPSPAVLPTPNDPAARPLT